MNPDRRPGAIDVSSSVWMNPGFTGRSSISCAASVTELSKSGSSSSGGTSTIVFRLPGPDAGDGFKGRFGTTGFTRGGSAAAGLPIGGRPRGFNFGGGGGGTAFFLSGGAG